MHDGVVQFVNRIADFVIKNRWAIIALNIVLIGVLFSFMGGRAQKAQEHVAYMTELRNNPLVFDSSHVAPSPIMNSDYHVWFDDHDENLNAFDRFQKVFAKEDQLLIVIRSKSGDLFTNENLASLKKLTDDSWSVPYISRVQSITNFNYTYVGQEIVDEEPIDADLIFDDEEEESAEDNLVVEDVIESLPLSANELKDKKALVLNDNILSKYMISKSGDLTQISLTAIIPGAFPQGFEEARASAEKLVAQITQANNDLEIKLSGTVMLNSSFFEFAMKDISSLIPIMFIFIFVVLALTLKSFWGTFLPLGVLVTSVMFPILLFVGVLEYSLTNVTMNTMQILTAVAIADSVHVLSVFYRNLRLGKSKYEAIRITIQKNFMACLITSVTTAIGFFSLVAQEIPPFQDLGLFAGTGTLYAFFASLFTMPALLAVLPIKAKAKTVEKAQKKDSVYSLLSKLEPFTFKYQRAIRLSSLILTVVSVYFLTTIIIDSNSIKYFKEGTEFRAATEYIDENIIGTNPIEFSFDSGEENGVNGPEFLKKIEKFSDYIDSHPEYNITYVASIVDVVKRLNKTLHGNQDDFFSIPDKDSVLAPGDTLSARRLIAQYLMLYSLSLPQGMDLNNQRSIDERFARVTAFQTSIPSSEQIAVADSLNAWLEREMPEVRASAIGVPVMFGNLMNKAIPGMLKSLMISLILITLTLALTFRSWKIALFSMVPNVWPLVVLFGVVGMSGYVVDLSVAIVGMITLGIAVDDTVHFLVKYIDAKYAGKNTHEAISWTFQNVGRPLFFTSIILIVGFGVLVISQFSINSNMGMLCSAVITLALFADFILLPAMLFKYDVHHTVADDEG
ncbi:MAG: MMPL family transporter [Fibrobacterales bacterium]